jgi:NitT/TauT family transport system ATP-binding protein
MRLRADPANATAAPGNSVDAPGSESETADVIVAMHDVEKVFDGGGGPVHALADVSLTVRKGEFVSLIGPSGCGKSTLLRLIGDLLQPTAGTVLVKGHPARIARMRREYAMVFQAPVLFEWRDIRRNVALPLEVLGLKRAGRDSRARAMLELVELLDFQDHHPWQLSGGMQQRVALARAFSVDPAMLLMVEPFGALDEMTRERMNLELHRLWAQTGITIVFVTHSIPEAVFLSTRVVVMSARPGRITASIAVDLDRARTIDTRESQRYFEHVTRVRSALRDGEQSAGGLERVRAEGLSA